MKKWPFVALLLVGATVLGATVLREPIGYAASPFTNVIVGNDATHPVPVTSAPSPLWQGTPYVDTQVILEPAQCEAFKEVPAGKVLYVQNVIARFNVKPGPGVGPALRITPLGGAEQFVFVPTYPSAPVRQVAGIYDGYQGSLNLGLPTSTAPEACLFGDSSTDYAGTIIVTGYLVNAN